MVQRISFHIATAVFDLLLLVASVSTMLIPAWHIPSLNIGRARLISYELGYISFMGTLYMTVLVSFERYMSICRGIEFTIKKTIICIVSVIIFAIFFNIPVFFAWELESESGRLMKTDLTCNPTFYKLYFVGANICIRILIPIPCLVGFNLSVYKEVNASYVLEKGTLSK